MRLISEKEYATFQEKLKSIPQSQREKLSVSLIDQLERDIYLIGATAVLDRLQDAGNVGSILRSAAALGVRQIVALKGTAALGSAKVMRAGMGAHFALRLVEQVQLQDLERLALPLLATSSHGGETLGACELPHPAAWVFGHEGQGVSEPLLAQCQRRLRIPQPGGEESLNVAAAAAICLYESAQGPR